MNSIYHDGNKNIGGAALGFTTWVFSVGIMSVFIIPGIIYMHGVGAAWFGIALALGEERERVVAFQQKKP